MWKPTQQEALWFHGGNLHQSRHYSLYLALQLKARVEGIDTPGLRPAGGPPHQVRAGAPRRPCAAPGGREAAGVSEARSASSSRSSICSCTPPSIPDSTIMSRISLLSTSVSSSSVVRPSRSAKVAVLRAGGLSPSGHALVDLSCRPSPRPGRSRGLAVEADLEAAGGLHEIPPGAADAQVDLGDLHRPAPSAPPAHHQIGRRPRAVDQVPRRVELAHDQDLLVGRQRHRRARATRHSHHLLSPAP